MNIASIISESLLKTGGYEVFTYNLLISLAMKGHKVTLYITESESRKNGWFYNRVPFDYRSLPWNSMSIFKRFPSIIHWWFQREQKRHRYDVWQVMGAYPEGELVSGLSGAVPLVLRTHGDDIQTVPELGYGMRMNPIIDKKIRYILGRMDRVIALTESVTGKLNELGVQDERIAIIPNGVDCAYFLRKRDIIACRKKWGVGPDEFLILTVGRNHPKKGFDLIPQVAKKLVTSGLGFKWLVVGRETEKLRPVFEANHLHDYIGTVPAIGIKADYESIQAGQFPAEELVEMFAMSDLFVLPSRIETFGRVLLESMAAGTPVLTTDCVGCRDVVGHGKFGKMVAVDDVNEMTGQILMLARNPEELKEMRKQGFERASNFDWDAVSDSYLKLYSSLANSKRLSF
jgi:glycosyltransferase involved in cell wall biosynthesis